MSSIAKTRCDFPNCKQTTENAVKEGWKTLDSIIVDGTELLIKHKELSPTPRDFCGSGHLIQYISLAIDKLNGKEDNNG